MNHIRRKFILLICIVLLAGTVLPGAGLAEAGWTYIYNSEIDGYEYYYVDENGNRVTGWQTIDGKEYYFLEDGKRAGNGWLTLGSDKYYLVPYAATGSYSIYNDKTQQYETFLFGRDGKLQSGWVSIENENYTGEKVTQKYYCGKDGKQVTGFVTIGGKKYYFNPSLVTGAFSIYDEETSQSIRYYADENGVIQTGWVEEDGARMYYGEDGKRLTGWQEIDGARYYLNPSPAIGEKWINEDDEYNCYYFDKDGKMQTGWVSIDREIYEGETVVQKYYYGKDGKQVTGFATIGGKNYYLSPSLATGFFTRYDETTGEESKYYADKNGVIQTGLVTVDEGIFFFDEDGKGVTGWQETDGKTYYFDPYWNQAYTGLNYIDENYYYFAEDGTMQTGFVTMPASDGKTTVKQYFGEDGKRLEGWLTLGEDTYYLTPNVKTGLTGLYDETNKKINRYFFDEDGKMQTGLITADGYTFFFGKDGKAVSGWQEAGEKWYYFSEYGNQAYTGLSYIDDHYYFFAEDGAMQTGWINTGDTFGWRLFEQTGAMLKSFAGMSSVSIPEEVDYLKDEAFAGIGRDFIVNVVPGSYAERFARRIGLQYSNGEKMVSGYQIKNLSEKVQWVVDNYTDEDMSDLEKVRALHDWLIYNAHYDTTYSIHSASGVLLGTSGVCSSYADAYQLLLNAAGIENRYVSGSADNGSGGGAQGHAWNMVKLGDNWYHVDCTWDDPTDLQNDVPFISGWERYDYFLISDEQIGKDHFWRSSVQAPENMVWLGEPGWQQNGADWFYFDRDGIMTTGTARIDGTLYGFRDDGRLMTAGWQKASGRWYRAAEGGILTENTWLQEGGVWYYMGKNGAMQTGWAQIDGKWYYFSESGAMQTGWLQAGESWYLLKADGSMATGWAEAGGTWFCFSDTGVMQTGWIEDNGSWYFLDSSGAMATGWLQDGGSWYLMGSSGAMQTGWKEVGGMWFFFSADGRMRTGWATDNGGWYYMNSDGAMATGWLQDGGNWYYLNDGGRMVTGEVAIGGRTCIFDAGGVWLGYAD